MPKIITSPVKRWPGTVELYDPLTLPMVLALDEAFDRSSEQGFDGSLKEEGTEGNLFKHYEQVLPSILRCVKEWHIEGVTPSMEQWPATPPRASATFTSWLIGEVMRLFDEAEDTDPND